MAYDAVLFVTPEYNRSVPAPLKNAIDVGSHPYGHSVWDGKPGAVVSVSPGAIGAFGANHRLRQSLVFLNVPCLQMPEAYISDIANMFDETGVLSDHSARNFLQKFMTASPTGSSATRTHLRPPRSETHRVDSLTVSLVGNGLKRESHRPQKSEQRGEVKHENHALV